MPPDDDWQRSTAAGTVWEELEGSAQRAAQRYSLGGELGRGGMGVVTLANDAWLDRAVAMKRPRVDLPAAMQDRVMREARITAQLNHPSIVPVLDVGEDAQGPFYTMPVLTGRSLAEAVGEVGLAGAVRALGEVARALAHAHRVGVVHRDVKPANILLGDDGEVWLVDWGVAWEATAPTTDRVGTAGFADPDQLRGVVGPRCDVYGLGRTLGWVLEALPDTVPELEAVAARCVAVDRYADAAAVADELDSWLAGLRVSAYAYSPLAVLKSWAVAHRGVLAVSLAAAVLVALAVSWGLVRQGQERQRADRALSASLARGAVARWQAGERPEAEVLAAHALAAADSSVARGVAMAFNAMPRPELLDRVELPCDAALLESGQPWCASDTRVRVFGLDGAEVWSQAVPERVVELVHTGEVHVARLASGGIVWMRDGKVTPLEEELAGGVLRLVRGTAVAVSDGRRVGWLDGGRFRWTEPLCPDYIEAAHVEGQALRVACRQMYARVGTLEDPGPLLDVGGSGAAWSAGPRALLGTFEGELLEWTGTQWARLPSHVGPVRWLVDVGGAVAVLGETGVPRLHLANGSHMSLPVRAGGVGGAGGEVSVVHGRQLSRYRLVGGASDHLDRVVGGGVSTFDVSPSGDRVAVGSASGELAIWEPKTGRLDLPRTAHLRGAKGVRFIDEDHVLVEHEHQLGVWSLVDDRFSPLPAGEIATAEVDGEVVAVSPYAPEFRLVLGETLHRVPMRDRVTAMVPTSGGWWVADRAGSLLRLDAAGAVLESHTSDAPLTELASVDGDLLWASGGALHWGFPSRQQVGFDGRITALAADTEHAVVGLDDGRILVLDHTGEEQLVVYAHQRLVSRLVLREGVLFSAGWDGHVRRLLLQDAPLDVNEAEAHWGLDLERSLDL